MSRPQIHQNSGLVKPKDVSQIEIRNKRWRSCMTIFCHVLSPQGVGNGDLHLVAGSSTGELFIWNLAKALLGEGFSSPSPTFFRNASINNEKALADDLLADCCDNFVQPHRKVKAHDGTIYSLISDSDSGLLISAGGETMCAWSWDELIASSRSSDESEGLDYTPLSPTWIIGESHGDRMHCETNAMALDNNGKLYSACGDCTAKIWDLNTQKLQSTLEGHMDYLHCISLRQKPSQCVTGSEDGSIRFWDLRASSRAVHIIEPYKSCPQELLTGKWVGCLDINESEDWLNMLPQHVLFTSEGICAGGNEPFITQYTMNGKMNMRIPCTPTSVFGVQSISDDEAAELKALWKSILGAVQRKKKEGKFPASEPMKISQQHMTRYTAHKHYRQQVSTVKVRQEIGLDQAAARELGTKRFGSREQNYALKVIYTDGTKASRVVENTTEGVGQDVVRGMYNTVNTEIMVDDNTVQQYTRNSGASKANLSRQRLRKPQYRCHCIEHRIMAISTGCFQAISDAITALRKPGSAKGVSRDAIKKFVGDASTAARVNLALKRAVAAGKIVQVKDSFKLVKVKPAPKKKPAKKKTAPKKKTKKTVKKKTVKKTTKKSKKKPSKKSSKKS
eukprot:UC4_evm1s1590